MLVHFVGGLGDALLNIFQTDNYTFLESIGPEEKIHVNFVVGNPKLQELLEWHPKRKQLILSTHDLEFPINDAVLTKWNLPLDIRPFKCWGIRPSPAIAADVKWHINQNDADLIKMIGTDPYIAFCCSAGHPLRNIPPKICSQAALACNRLGVRVLQLGSTYNITSPIHACTRQESPISGVAQYANLIDCLSLPGFLQVLDNAAGILACHSGPLIEAWFRRKPSYLVYPDNIHSFLQPDAPHSRFNFGMLDPECKTISVGKWHADHFENWLRETVGIAARGEL